MEATATAAPKREGEPLAPDEQPPSKQQKPAAAAPVPSMAAPMMDDSDDDDAAAAPSGPAGGEGGEGARRWMAAPAEPKAVRIGDDFQATLPPLGANGNGGSRASEFHWVDLDEDGLGSGTRMYK